MNKRSERMFAVGCGPCQILKASRELHRGSCARAGSCSWELRWSCVGASQKELRRAASNFKPFRGAARQNLTKNFKFSWELQKKFDKINQISKENYIKI
jgi:hypothetical protein